MEINDKLKEFFHLEENQDDYQYAITPKSCGGGEEFKLLALLGDRVLNLELYEILIAEGITDSGTLTQRLSYIHNEDILYLVGQILEIDKIMTPTDSNHQITKGELKESVEALIGANFKAHGFGPHKELIKNLYEIINEIENEVQGDKQVQLFNENPKGKVLELFQAHGFVPPVFNTQRVGGPDHAPFFRCTLTGTYFDREINIESDVSNNKRATEKDAAVKFLLMIEGETEFKPVI
jgi:ribonuclease-3